MSCWENELKRMSWWAQIDTMTFPFVIVSLHSRWFNSLFVRWHWKISRLIYCHLWTKQLLTITKMENITKIRYSPLPPDSPYVKPFRMYYVQNGKEKNWDLLKVHDSVSIIILNKTRNKLVFVKQFRPGEHWIYVDLVHWDHHTPFFPIQSCLSFNNHVRPNELYAWENRFGEISGKSGNYAGTLCRYRRQKQVATRDCPRRGARRVRLQCASRENRTNYDVQVSRECVCFMN